MSQVQLATKTRIKYSTTISTSLMIVISINAISYIGGMLIAMSVISQRDLNILNKFSCQKTVKSKPSFEKYNKNFSYAVLDDVRNSIRVANSEFSNKKNAKIQKNLLGLLEKRKKLFIELMNKDPKAALYLTLSPEDRDNIEKNSMNCVEKEVALEGDLEILHADFLPGVQRGSVDEFYLNTRDNKKIKLNSAGKMKKALFSGTRMQVRGFLLDDNIIFDGTSELGRTQNSWGGVKILKIPSNPPVLGEQKFLVLMADFQDAKNIYGKDMEESITFPEINAYYQEVSNGKISVSADVYDGKTLPFLKIGDYNLIKEEVIRAYDPDIDFSKYSRLMIIVPTNFETQGRWGLAGGLGTLDKVDVITLDGTVKMTIAWISSANPNSSASINIHEIGHNFGNHHADFYNCGSVAYDLNGCIGEEYWDRYDVMGSAAQAHFNALHKEIPGWFNAGNILTVTEDNIYNLKPLELQTQDLQALKIQRTSDDYLFVEFRQSIGLDAGMDKNVNMYDDVFDGALLHSNSLDDFYSRSWLIDPTPPADNHYSALKLNNTFIDPLSGASIKTVSKDDSLLSVEVLLKKRDFILPAVEITEPVKGQKIAGEVKISANTQDESGIEKVEFEIGLDYLHNEILGIDTTVPYELTFDSRLFRNGYAFIRARAYDLSGVLFGVPNNSEIARIVVDIKNVDDLESPTINIVSPQDGDTVVNPLKIKAEAYDNIRVSKVFFYDGENFIGGDYDFPFEIQTSLTRGEHRLRATAYDNIYNQGFSNEVSIAMQDMPPTIKIIYPYNGKILTGMDYIYAVAEDDMGINKIEIYKDNEDSPFIINSYSGTEVKLFFDWNTAQVADGQHKIMARAYDNGGNITDSNAADFFIDNRPITIMLVTPQNDDIVSGKITLSALATGPINWVHFFIKGDIWQNSFYDREYPYETTFNTSVAPNGVYKIYAAAEGIFGFKKSQEINVLIKNLKFFRGDANTDGKVDITDPISILEYIFRNGAEPKCKDAADSNDDGFIDISDAVTLLLYMYSETISGLPSPGALSSGPDPTLDDLGCEISQ